MTTTGKQMDVPREGPRRQFPATWLLLAILTASCTTVPRGTGLTVPEVVERPVAHRAWLEGVRIADVAVNDRSTVEDSLTANLLEYLREGAYFTSIDLAPGSMQPDDLVLHFELDRYEQVRRPHGAYFPAAILTATLYIWCGGPIFTDSSDLSGSLVVRDVNEVMLANATASVRERHSVSLYSPEYALPSGIDARTKLVRELLGRVYNSLRSKEGHL
jgi:hypothetical protein